MARHYSVIITIAGLSSGLPPRSFSLPSCYCLMVSLIGANSGKPAAIGWFGHGAVWLVIALVALNVVSTLLECGFGAFPDNPVAYQLLKSSP